MVVPLSMTREVAALTRPGAALVPLEPEPELGVEEAEAAVAVAAVAEERAVT